MSPSIKTVAALSVLLLSACLPKAVRESEATATANIPSVQTTTVQTVFAEFTSPAVTHNPVPTLPSFSLIDFNANQVGDDIAVNADGKTIVVATNGFHIANSGENGVWLWDTDNFEYSVAAFGHLLPGPHSVAFSHDGSLLAISGCETQDDFLNCNQTILVLQWKNQRVVQQITAKGRAISRLYFSIDGSIIAAQDVSGIINLWDLETRQLKYSFKSERGIEENNFSYNPNGLLVAVGVGNGIEIWDLSTKTITKTISDIQGGIFFAPVVTFDRQGQFLATGGCEAFDFESCVSSRILILDVQNWERKAELSFNSRITSIEFSPDNQLLAIGSWEGLRLWDFQNNTNFDVLDYSQIPIMDLAFSPDGKKLIIGSSTGLHAENVSEIIVQQ